MIAEVLSESTRRTEMGEKLEAHLTIPSLEVYLLMETDQPRVIAYRRRSESSAQAGGFVAERYNGLDAVVPLAEVSANLPLRELYEWVEFSAGGESA